MEESSFNKPIIPKPASSERFHIKRMLPRHFKMLELRLAGLNNKQIASTVGCTAESVKTVVRSPLFQYEYQRRLKEQNARGIAEEVKSFVDRAKSVITENAVKAAQTQVDLLDAEDDSVRLRASGSILDRALGDTKDSAPSVNVTINSRDADLLLVALRESKEFPNAENNVQAADRHVNGLSDSQNPQGAAHQAAHDGSGD